MVESAIRVVTTDEFDSIVQDNHERLLELVHGEVVEKMPTEAHGKLAALIAYFFLAFIRPRGIKAHVGVEVRHQLPGDRYNSRLPDVSVRLSDSPPVDSGPVLVFPDLAVEIQSPDDRPHQMRQKGLHYLQNGSRLVWLVYTQGVEVCTLDAASNLVIETFGYDAVLTGGDVLPGFELPVSALFDQGSSPMTSST
jgi:Uma2 family endonuclease